MYRTFDKDFSGMNFIADNSYLIEESQLYKSIGRGIKTVEFIRTRKNNLLLVEAKKSFPKEDASNFNKEIKEICEKFIHSLNLYSSVKTGVNEEIFDNDFNPPDRVVLKFILVINNPNIIKLRKIKFALENSLPLYFKSIWKPEVFVINHKTAVKYEITTAQ